MLIDDLNPYGSFRAGQRECIQAMLDAVEEGQKIIEFNGPTGMGKSLCISIVCRALEEEYPKSIYTSPQKTLVSQIANDKNIGMAALLGRDNYYCPKVASNSARDCPIPAKHRRKSCPRCEYITAKDEFLGASLGVSTLAKILVDRSIPKPDILVVDESQNLESALLDQSEIGIPDAVDIKDLVESSRLWVKRIEMEILRTEVKLEKIFSGQLVEKPRTIKKTTLADEFATHIEQKAGSFDQEAATKVAKELVRYNRICEKARGVLRMAEEAPDSFIITKDRTFRMMSGRQAFQDLIMNVKVVILASGTPTTQLLAPPGYASVVAPHPIDVSRRMVYFEPVGKMNVASRDATMEKMGSRIAQLHELHGKSTIVHCHSYPIATRLGNIIYDEGVRCQWVDQKDREGSIKTWMETENTCLMAVACSEGLDLSGPKYPLNIIAKIGFGFRGDQWMIEREKMDKPLPNYQHFEDVRVATEIQQAAGRTTRGPDDWSETWILDASFESFYRRNHNLFQQYFKDALRRKN